MKKIKFLSLLLLFAFIVSAASPLSAFAIEQPDTASDAIVLVDTVSGNVLFEKNADTKIYPASTTKIMTVFLAVEAIEMGEVTLSDYVTASENCNFDMIEDGSSAGIVPGETMTLESLLYCAMVSSANEACNIIAEYISGSIPAFVEKMNTRARELGCTNTYFNNTHGLPDSSHYTTARDFSIISLEAITHPLFMEICNTPSITIPATNKSDARYLSNTNGLINQNSISYPGYYYEAASGIKTGHTDDAGYCLISTASKNGMTLLAVVMGGRARPKESGADFDNFTDSIALYNWAFENYSYRDILKMTEQVTEIPVKMGSDASSVAVHPQDAVKALLPNDEDIGSYEQKITIYSSEEGKELMAPIEAGEILGEITIERDGVVYGSSQLIASSSVELSYGKYITSQIVSTLKKPLVIIAIIIVVGLLGLYIYVVVRYQMEKKKHMAKVASHGAAALRASKPAAQVPYQAAKRTRAQEEIYPDDDKPDMGYNDIDLSQPTETQAERDYFAEFFGRK